MADSLRMPENLEQLQIIVKEAVQAMEIRAENYHQEAEVLRKRVEELESVIETGADDFPGQIAELRKKLADSEKHHAAVRDDYIMLSEELKQVRTERDRYKVDVKMLNNRVNTITKELNSYRRENDAFKASAVVEPVASSTRRLDSTSNGGYYAPWPRAAELISYDNFVTLREMLSLTRTLREVNFWVHTSREAAVKAVRTMTFVQPFSRTKRFIDDSNYINVSDGAIATLLITITDALSFGERAIEATSDKNAGKTYGSQNDAKVAFTKSVSRIQEMIRQTDPLLLPTYGIFDRVSIETYLRIGWVNGSD